MQQTASRFPVWLIVVYVLALATILAWPFVAFMSVFAFDAPGSAQNPAIYATVGLILAYPLLPLVGVSGSFVAYRKAAKPLAYVLAGIGSLPLAVLVFLLLTLIITDLAFVLGGKL